MTTRRTVIIASIVSVCICLAIATWTMLPNGVTKENFDRIEPGMTIWQVKILLRSSGKMGIGGHGVRPWIGNGNGNEIYIHFKQSSGTAKEGWFTGSDGVEITRKPL